MKLIPAILAFLVSAAFASPGDPGAAAIAFLEKLRTGNINLEPGGDTALIPQTSEKKRREIRNLLARLILDIEKGSLEVSKVRVEDDLGAVLVRKSDGFDPARLQVIPVALVKRGAAWVAAPVPASFENTGLGYSSALRKRLDDLEEWMLRQKVIDLEELRSQTADRMRKEIESALSVDQLRSLSAAEVGERFLEACRRGAVLEIKAMLGGLSAELPDDWPLRIAAAENATAEDARLKRPWRWLVSEDVPRAVVQQEEDAESARLAIACLDPKIAPDETRIQRILTVRLDMTRTPEGFWRIDLPGHLLQPDMSDPEDEDRTDLDFGEEFAAAMNERHPVSPKAGARDLCDMLLKAIESGRLEDLFPMLARDPDSRLTKENCLAAASQWRKFRSSLPTRVPALLEMQEAPEAAAALIQVFSLSNPDLFNPDLLVFEKSEQGWLWNPSPSQTTEDSFKQWQEERCERWKNHWQEELLKECPVLKDFEPSAAVSDEEATKLVASLLGAFREGRIRDAIDLTARLGAADSPGALIRNLGYETTGAAKDTELPQVQAVHRGNLFAAVGMRTHPGGKPAFPLYPVIHTARGPRVLLEVDLRESASRSRDFLNKTSIERVAKIHPEAGDDLRKLMDLHRQSVRPEGEP